MALQAEVRQMEIGEGIKHGIALENTSSETCICSVVTHEVTMHCNGLADDPERIESIPAIAQHVVAGVYESHVPFHSFAISELTRGILHGLVCVGLDVSYVTRPATKGIREGVASLGEYSQDAEQAIREGVRQTLEDLGMRRLEEDQSLDLPGFFLNQTATFGEATY